MARLFADPLPIAVTWAEGELVAIELPGTRLRVVEVVRRWRADGEWWDGIRAHARECFTVRTGDGTLCDIVLDRTDGRWSLQRLYD
jgi:hypothetical protein